MKTDKLNDDKPKKPRIVFWAFLVGILSFFGSVYIALLALVLGLIAMIIVYRSNSNGIWFVVIALLFSLLSIGFHCTKDYLLPSINNVQKK